MKMFGRRRAPKTHFYQFDKRAARFRAVSILIALRRRGLFQLYNAHEKSSQ